MIKDSKINSLVKEENLENAFRYLLLTKDTLISEHQKNKFYIPLLETTYGLSTKQKFKIILDNKIRAHNSVNEKTLVSLLNDKSYASDSDIYKGQSLISNRHVDAEKVPANKEWVNSVYTYNKNYAKPLVIASDVASKVLSSFFNLSLLVKGKKAKVSEILEDRFSLDRVLVSKAEVKHTNDKINLTVYIYNRNKKTLLRKLSDLYSAISNTKRTFVNKKHKDLSAMINKRIIGKKSNSLSLLLSKPKVSNINSLTSSMSMAKVLTAKNVRNLNTAYAAVNKLRLNGEMILNKIKEFNLEVADSLNLNSSNLFSLTGDNNKDNRNTKHADILFSNENNNETSETINFNNHFSKYEEEYLSRYYYNIYNEQILRLYYVRALLFNNNKFKNWFLLGLKKSLQQLYNKRVELNVVNQKYFYLNSDIFIKAVATRVRDRNNSILSEMYLALSSVRLPRIRGGFFAKLREAWKSGKKVKKITLRENYSVSKTVKRLRNEIFNGVRHRHIHGIRIEAAGRLSRRLTAARSVFKVNKLGSLKNYDTTRRCKSVISLRGRIRPNIQYTNVNSKTRNGAFGLKGWISNNS